MKLIATVDAEGVLEGIEALPERLRGGVARVVEGETGKLLSLVQAKLSGEVLELRSGRLRSSFRETGLKMGPMTVSDSVATDSPVARIQEYGGRIEIPEIVPKNAKVLAFPYGGRIVFAKRTRAHEVEIPQRSFMRSALAESAASFIAATREAAKEVLE